MGKVLGIINLLNEKHILKDLTTHRNNASVPFAGRYRLIDFTMSNFVNANISMVAVFPKERYLSVIDHLGSGREWNMDRRIGGLFMLPPMHPNEAVLGDMKQFYDHLSFFKRTKADTVIITPGHHVCKADYNKLLAYHRNTGADITVVYKDFIEGTVEKPMYHKCSLNENDDVTDISLFNFPKKGDHLSLETYVMSTSLLVELITSCVPNGECDLLKDGIKANLHRLKVKGYHFTGELPFISSIESFYEANMKFLNPNVLRSYFSEDWSIYTKIKNEAPAKYAKSSEVTNSLIANGCDIQGTVENSILFRGVKVKKGAVVKNSIIMQRGVIGEDALIENVITDKEVTITKEQVLVGKQQPIVIKKSEVI